MSTAAARRAVRPSSLRCLSAQVQAPEMPYCSSTAEEKHAVYPHLFEPLTLPCGVTLRNRTLMGSMHTGLEEHHDADGGLGRMAAFYGERAAGGAGIIVTGGVAPNREGWVLPMAGKLSTAKEAAQHSCVTEAVHDNGGLIAMQILHAGRYAYHPMAVAPSKKKAPINVITPRALDEAAIRRTIDDFARCAELAKSCGYDGVEVMGSEGYLINEFLAPRTNSRTDAWGGSFENRSRLALETAQAVRRAVGSEGFALIFRVSLLELVDGGMTFDESVALSELLHGAGVDVVNTGIGWHEARVPTIATCVPRGAFAFATRNVKDALAKRGAAPLLCATNRINDAATAERILARGDADLVSLARPFLADENIVRKAWEGNEAETNTCIGCNQACLDHTFKLVPVSCLVNPRAGHETLLNLEPAPKKLAVAVVGAGPAGLSCASALGARGHGVTLFEASDRVGGQFNLAARVPGKGEFWETLRYFESQLEKFGVDVRLNTEADAAALAGFDRVVVATGVTPRPLDHLASSATVRVHSYVDVLDGSATIGDRVAVVGAGGIGFDVAEFLTHDAHHAPESPEELDAFCAEWGIDASGALSNSSGLAERTAAPPRREVHLLQRKKSALGAGLGKTTGWIHRAALRNRGVHFVRGCDYVEVSDDGFHVKVDGEPRILDVTDVVVCAGQISNDALFHETTHDAAYLIGGAQKAGELDAKRAIDQGYRLAADIENAKRGDVFEMPVGWQASALRMLRDAMGRNSA